MSVLKTEFRFIEICPRPFGQALLLRRFDVRLPLPPPIWSPAQSHTTSQVAHSTCTISYVRLNTTDG